MDCEKLHSDIEKLKSLRDELRSKIETAAETGEGKIEISNTCRQLTDVTDDILRQYLPDFVEHNPEAFKWQLGDKIDGFKDPYGDDATIYSIATLPDGSALIGGYEGALYHATKDENGEFKLGDKIDGFDIYDDIKSISTLPDGSALISGELGALYHATKDENGRFKLGDLIDGFKDTGGYYQHIESISTLPDGSALIGGRGGALYHATKDENGIFKLGDLIDGLDIYDDIYSISTLPDGSALIGGSRGALYHATKPPVNLDMPKQNLDKIAAKRESDS